MAEQQATNHSAEKLLKAIRENDIGTVESTLQKNPELVNCKVLRKYGITTPLLTACSPGTVGSDQLNIVKTLLKRGADKSATGYDVNEYVVCPFGQPQHSHFSRSTGGYGAQDDLFPLFIAMSATVPVIEELLNAGVPINQTNGAGQSALHATSMKIDNSPGWLTAQEFKAAGIEDGEAVQMMKMLIKKGATVNLQDSHGKTPLHYACGFGKRYLIQILLDNGADITIKDNSGLSPLDIVAHTYYNLTEDILDHCELTPQQIIEAYETVALSSSCPDPFEILSKATKMRTDHNLPKTILEPLECYGFVKEFETLKELEKYKDDPVQLKLQATLARERIFNGRYVNFMDEESLEVFSDADNNQMNALLRHYLELFKTNNDYLYFHQVFGRDTIQGRLFYPALEMDKDNLTEFVAVAMESCRRMQEKLESATKLRLIQDLTCEFEQTLLLIGAVVLRLLKRSNEADRGLAERICKELWQKFPAVTSPFSGYTAPLPHVLIFNKFHSPMFGENWLLYRYEILKILIDLGCDLNSTDSDGNTPLHIVIFYWPNDCIRNTSKPAPILPDSAQTLENIVTLLLEKGTYLHARNKMKITAMEVVIKHPTYYINTQVMQIMQKHQDMPMLKQITALNIREQNIPYQGQLPSQLDKFVNLH